MRNKKDRAVRYAVVGLGHIAQAAVLPAFAHAERNSRLTALISGDPRKLSTLARRYGVRDLYNYEEFDVCMESGGVDAVYICLPNSLHREYAVRAARAGVHVLCEKPLASTASDAREMVRACRAADVRLMTAYRLHFEGANLRAVKASRSGEIGEPRIFTSAFTMQVRDPANIRLKAKMGGGPLYDLGVYCINAARMLFRAEPTEVLARSVMRSDPRFDEVEEMLSAILRYPGDRIATFTCSFGAADVADYRLIGTRGSIRLDPAYEYTGRLAYTLAIGDSKRERSIRQRDQFAAELLYFSDCVLAGREPEPSGDEGLADVRIIEALHRAARTGRTVPLGAMATDAPPTSRQRIDRPRVRKRKVIHARSAHAT